MDSYGFNPESGSNLLVFKEAGLWFAFGLATKSAKIKCTHT